APYDDPPLLRADVGGLAERWVGDTTVTWAQLCRSTSMAEGDIYRLLSRTLEYLSQVHSLQATHPDLATVAAEALSRIRRRWPQARGRRARHPPSTGWKGRPISVHFWKGSGCRSRAPSCRMTGRWRRWRRWNGTT